MVAIARQQPAAPAPLYVCDANGAVCAEFAQDVADAHAERVRQRRRGTDRPAIAEG